MVVCPPAKSLGHDGGRPGLGVTAVACRCDEWDSEQEDRSHAQHEPALTPAPEGIGARLAATTSCSPECARADLSASASLIPQHSVSPPNRAPGRGPQLPQERGGIAATPVEPCRTYDARSATSSPGRGRD